MWSTIGRKENPRYWIFWFIIPLLRQFTIVGHENSQNMRRYYTVEQGNNTDAKRGNKMAGQNDPNFDLWNIKSPIRWFNIIRAGILLIAGNYETPKISVRIIC